MPYVVKIPKDPRLEERFQYYLKKIGEDNQYVFLQGSHEVIVPLGVSWPEAFELFRKIKVEGGYKRLPMVAEKEGRRVPVEEPTVVIIPKRNIILSVRLSDDEYELLKEDAYSVGRCVSDWARTLVMKLVYDYLAQEKFKEAMRKAKESHVK